MEGKWTQKIYHSEYRDQGTQFTDLRYVMYWEVIHICYMYFLKGWIFQYLLVMMIPSSAVFSGCNVLLNATRGTIAVAVSEVLPRKSTPGFETLHVLRGMCGNGREWTSFHGFMARFERSCDISIILSDGRLSSSPPPTDPLARFFLFILSLISLVITTFWFSAFSVRTCFRYFSVLMTISRPITKKIFLWTYQV
jgi:hypothetical protein